MLCCSRLPCSASSAATSVTCLTHAPSPPCVVNSGAVDGAVCAAASSADSDRHLLQRQQLRSATSGKALQFKVPYGWSLSISTRSAALAIIIKLTRCTPHICWDLVRFMQLLQFVLKDAYLLPISLSISLIF